MAAVQDQLEAVVATGVPGAAVVVRGAPQPANGTARGRMARPAAAASSAPLSYVWPMAVSSRVRVAGMPVPLGKAGVRALTELLARAAGVICVT